MLKFIIVLLVIVTTIAVQVVADKICGVNYSEIPMAKRIGHMVIYEASGAAILATWLLIP